MSNQPQKDKHFIQLLCQSKPGLLEDQTLFEKKNDDCPPPYKLLST
jgi:hypothetical protein